ncbi:hypothetical protein GF376_02655 [Candidatus Peregrinibacteria bacterium]|nr:hypothetical protein [Candidatus Peregrinibacteria bacterium]
MNRQKHDNNRENEILVKVDADGLDEETAKTSHIRGIKRLPMEEDIDRYDCNKCHDSCSIKEISEQAKMLVNSNYSTIDTFIAMESETSQHIADLMNILSNTSDTAEVQMAIRKHLSEIIKLEDFIHIKVFEMVDAFNALRLKVVEEGYKNLDNTKECDQKVGLNIIIESARILAHDGRNMLTGLQGTVPGIEFLKSSLESYLDSLIHHKLNLDEFQRHAKQEILTMQEEVSSMKNSLIIIRYLMQQLSDIYVFSTKSLELSKENINLIELLDKVSKPFKNKAQIQIVTNGNYNLFASEQLLFHVFFNLFQNSIKHAKVKNNKYFKINASVVGDDNCIEIRISDNGIGIPNKYLEEIFFDGFTASERTSGSGLGLAYCKRVVEVHDGTIIVNNLYDQEENIQGCEFVIRIPKEL